MSAHEVVHEQLEGVDGLLLVSHDTDVRVGFAPGAGMVGYSLRRRTLPRERRARCRVPRAGGDTSTARVRRT
ncbi:MAG TPA: hypothetical protein VES62_01770 [Thermoleophilaceae bacterium]|nr:hypothetical protein [Actinomycetota bacterium]HYN49626.1 hypothetical protein [Thermoleophilaceae bacterium]